MEQAAREDNERLGRLEEFVNKQIEAARTNTNDTCIHDFSNLKEANANEVAKAFHRILLRQEEVYEDGDEEKELAIGSMRASIRYFSRSYRRSRHSGLPSNCTPTFWCFLRKLEETTVAREPLLGSTIKSRR